VTSIPYRPVERTFTEQILIWQVAGLIEQDLRLAPGEHRLLPMAAAKGAGFLME
jgi:hypothetical protein